MFPSWYWGTRSYWCLLILKFINIDETESDSKKKIGNKIYCDCVEAMGWLYMVSPICHIVQLRANYQLVNAIQIFARIMILHISFCCYRGEISDPTVAGRTLLPFRHGYKEKTKLSGPPYVRDILLHVSSLDPSHINNAHSTINSSAHAHERSVGDVHKRVLHQPTCTDRRLYSRYRTTIYWSF